MQKKNFTAAQALMLMRETREVSCLFTYLFDFCLHLFCFINLFLFHFSLRSSQMWDFCNSWAIWITNLELKDTENYLFKFFIYEYYFTTCYIALIMNLIIQLIEKHFVLRSKKNFLLKYLRIVIE